MGSYRFVVLTNPTTPAQEDEFNNWYSNQHLGDVTSIPGIVSGQRFKLNSTVSGPKSAHNYLAIYEIETDDLSEVMKELGIRAGTAAMPISEAMDGAGVMGWIFEAITPRVQGRK